MRLLHSVAVLLAMAAPALADDDAVIDKYIERAQSQRKAAIQSQSKQLQEARKGLSPKEAKQRLKSRIEELARIKAGEPPRLPLASLDDGATGFLLHTAKIASVAGDDMMLGVVLIERGAKAAPERVWIKGFPTVDIEAGEGVLLPNLFVVDGKKPDGEGGVDIPVLRAIDKAAVEKAFAAARGATGEGGKPAKGRRLPK